jgi:hypothetical protein
VREWVKWIGQESGRVSIEKLSSKGDQEMEDGGKMTFI